MKRILFISLSLLLILGFSNQAFADNLTIKWQNPEKYTDVKSATESQKRYEKRVIDELTEHFEQLAKQLPVNTTLKVKVSNVDLAGNIEYVGVNRIRVMKDIHGPTISLTYTLIDNTKEVLLMGEEKVRSRDYLQRTSNRYKNDFLAYEKNMLTKWFSTTFIN